MSRTSVLLPAVAGAWYPAGRDELAGLVDRLIDEARTRASTRAASVTALVAPHAGYAYSGAVAASAFHRVAGQRFDRVVLLGPSHHFGFSGAAVPEAAVAQRTPLGDVPFDEAALETLRRSAVVRAEDRVFAPEHALESEIPFLQRVLGTDVPIVPILLGGGSTRDDALRLAADLEPLVSASTLVIVSSDFTHYGPRFGYVPFADRVPERLRELDLGAAQTIAAGDAAGFARYADRTGTTICGRRAIDVLLALPAGAGGGTLLEYDTSGRMTGDFGHSVSYASLVFPSTVAAAGAP
jgi:AmmeMemoRadiSam system protein B